MSHQQEGDGLGQGEEDQCHEWPGNSHNLNLIENLRAIMKARLKRTPNMASMPLFERAIKLMLVKVLPISLMKKLAHSVPRRLKMCIENQSQISKYRSNIFFQSLLQSCDTVGAMVLARYRRYIYFLKQIHISRELEHILAKRFLY
jgi:hypothetical protein